MTTLNIDGHEVPEHDADRFFDARTGRRITDEEWDESKRRILAAEALEGDDAITWEPVDIGGAS